MNVYVDKKNLESFIFSADNEYFEGCNRMLKKYLNVHINMSVEEFAQSAACMAWAKTLLAGRGERNNAFDFRTEDSIFQERPILKELIERFDKEKCSSIYLLDDPYVNEIREKGNLIASGEKEVETLHRLQIGEEEEQCYIRSMNLESDFRMKWEGIDCIALPCSDIIICDPYILSNQWLYEKNLYALLRRMAKGLHNTRLRIVIISLKETQNGKKSDSLNYNKIRKMIKKLLKDKTIDAQVSFVLPLSSKDFGEHDRTILTNYVLYNSGATLNFYNSKGQLTTNGRYFTAYSLAFPKHEQMASDFLKDMQQLIYDIQKGEKQGEILSDGENPSNLLSFNSCPISEE